MSQKTSFIAVWERESMLTLKILKAYPADKLDMKPHAKLRTARDLMWVFVREAGMLLSILNGGIDFSQTPPPAPQTLEEICEAFEGQMQKNKAMFEAVDEAEFQKMTKFPVGPKQMGELGVMDLCWIMLHDMIHHRGQLSVYFRLADAALPSIYGPTADEPWN